MPMFEIGDRELNVDEPYLVAQIEGGKHEGKWGIFTTHNYSSRNASNGFYLQEARPTKREAVKRAKEMYPAVGSPIGVLVLNKDQSLDRFVPEPRSWETYARYTRRAFNESRYGGDD